MPFAGVHRPAIGVSLLKSELENIGVKVKINYFNVRFAEIIGLDLYDQIAEGEFANPSLIGELVFSKLLFDRNEEEHFKNMTQILSGYTQLNLDKISAELKFTQDMIPQFVHSCVSNVIDQNPHLVGFTSTFHQNCASLLLAKEIKEKIRNPIILGGANCEGQMGFTLLKHAPWIDFICSGEGDIAFIQFVKHLLKNELNSNINGILSRQSDPLHISLTNPVMDLDDLPFPDFDDYFNTIAGSKLKNDLDPSLVLETSRGCWWGELSQCTFCGLNGSTMKYRSKSVQRVLLELEHMIKKYKLRKFNVVDNILDLKYIDDLFPKIISQGLNVQLFYETKSNLSKQQLMLMKKAGVQAIQPGIESLSDNVLSLMKKGVSAVQNIQLLKWCREIGIKVYWNLLFGFPTEPEIEYAKMAKIVPLLFHLWPPEGCTQIVMDRFSPYFLNPSENGLVSIRPTLAYKFVYPFRMEELYNIGYHFDFDYVNGRDPSCYTQDLQEQIRFWRELWSSKTVPQLNMIRVKDLIMINDTRPCRVLGIHILANEKAKVFEACDIAHTFYALLIKVQKNYPMFKENDLEYILSELIQQKLMLYDNGKYLSLAAAISR
jgi:ribosomal peptide maturation radical SAM protein 1